MSVADHHQHRLGLLLVGASAVAWSTAGFFTRLIPLDAWTILFWRGVFGGLFIAFYVWRVHRADTFRVVASMGWPGWFVTLCSTLGMTTFIPALKLTTVADVAIIYAATPFAAAALAWLWLRETLSAPTLLASAAAFIGIVITVGGSTVGGSLAGDLLAVVMTLALAAMTVAIRRYRDVAMLPAACLSNILGSLVSLPFAAPFTVEPVDMAYLALFGFVQMSLGLTLFTIGSRLIPAAESALINALEAPLAPLWVFLAFQETPSGNALFGGGIVMAAIFGHILWSRRADAVT